jgi:hypothetical protein
VGRVYSQNGRSFENFKILNLCSRHRWEDNIRKNLEKIDVNTRNWNDLVQNSNYRKVLVNVALNLLVP